MNYIIRDFRDISQETVPGWENCPDTRNILTQFKYICKQEGILNHKQPWDAFERTIALSYSYDIDQFAFSEDASLICRLCGHYGCKYLYEARCKEPIIYKLTDSCNIKLPESVICGSECIGIPEKMRKLLAELREYATDIHLKNGRLDVSAIKKSLREPISIYVPERMCIYDWPTELYCTSGEFKWTDWYSLQVKKNKSGWVPKVWRVTTFTKPSICNNFDYMIHIK